MANKIDFDTSRLRARIRRLRGNFDSESPEFKKALLRIGLLLENRIILNIRSERLIDTGRLINSIRHEIKELQDGYQITAGSFGVPYAAVHEFGGNISVSSFVRAAHTRIQNGKTVNVRQHQVSSHTRYYRERPFVRPAFEESRITIIDILRALGK